MTCIYGMKQTNANSFDTRSAGEGAMDQPLFGESRPRVSRPHTRRCGGIATQFNVGYVWFRLSSYWKFYEGSQVRQVTATQCA